MASKREDILEYIQNTLLPTVKTASGYNYTLASIHRGIKAIRSLSDDQFPAVFIPGVDEVRTNRTQVHFSSELNVVLLGYVKRSKASPNATGTGIQKDLDKLIEDLTKVVLADRLQKNGQNPRTYSTEITQISTDDGDLEDVAGCAISIRFRYVTEDTAP